jgi:hypothetical protein
MLTFQAWSASVPAVLAWNSHRCRMDIARRTGRNTDEPGAPRQTFRAAGSRPRTGSTLICPDPDCRHDFPAPEVGTGQVGERERQPLGLWVREVLT